jgi:GDP-4-dehydro-6-deoxy-D-mannose reductase
VRTQTILVTGAAGFAGGHLLDLLQRDGLAPHAWHRPGKPPSVSGPAALRWRGVDLLDAGAVNQAIAELEPAAVYHCAGAAHVGQSWNRARETFATNVLGTHHLLKALRRTGQRARVLIPGSALVYRHADAALAEDAPLGPASPYALSKLAQEMLGVRAVEEDGQFVLLTRSFNHVGPGQDASFAASGFARQIARIEAGLAEPVIEVGNLDARRDLTDVRDTVRAYRLILERAKTGAVYNVCTGRAYAIRAVLDTLVSLSRVKVEIRSDPARYRPQDQDLLLGDPGRLERDLGWRPEIPLEQSLSDVLEYWRARAGTT